MTALEINLEKSRYVIDPSDIHKRIVVVGCGATGSAIAVLLARLGIIATFVDADVVEAKNINNQAFTSKHIGAPKVEALYDILSDINPLYKDKEQNFINGWFDGNSSYMFPEETVLFFCIDKGRRALAERFRHWPNISLVIETRIALDDCTVFAFNPRKHWYFYLPYIPTRYQEENPDSSELSPCGGTLSVFNTVSMTAAIAVNMMRAYVKKELTYNMSISKFYPHLETQKIKWHL